MGDFSDEVVKKRWTHSKETCESTQCTQKLKWEHRGDNTKSTGWHAHHHIPQEEGGKDTFDNCRILCIKCHDKIHGN